ncbi:MAG: hypothetical protein NC388_04785 [Clostridium sp.]|nr:hypothetical protein [Clostridium sp.]
MTKRLFVALAGWLLVAYLSAQSNYFYNYQLKSESKSVALNGKSQLVVVSPHNDLTAVFAGNATVRLGAPKAVKDGLYRYTTLIDLSAGKEIKATFARKGSALQTELKEVLKPNYSVTYKVEEVQTPISLDNQTGRNMSSKVHGESDLEFTTTIEGLEVTVSPALKSRMTHSRTAAGAYVTTVSIAMEALKAKQADLQAVEQEYAVLTQELNEGKITADDVAKLDRQEELEKKVEELSAEYASMCQVTVSAPKSNTLVVSIEDLAENERRAYAVLLMKQIEEKYNTSYDQYLSNALASAKTYKYKAAADFYRQAAEAPDAPADGKATCAARAADMDNCFGCMDMANKALRRLKTEKEKGRMVDYGLLEECYNVAIKNYVSLYELTKDEEFEKRADTLEEAFRKLGLVVEGNVVGTDFKGGVLQEEPVTGVDIYATPAGSRGVEKGTAGDKVGSVDAKGHYHVQLERGKYEGLLFVPVSLKGYKKNAWQSIKEQRHAKIDVKLYK